MRAYLTIISILFILSLKAQNEVEIGNQVWMSKNLDVDKFRNGDLVPQAKTKEEWEKAGKNKQPAWCYYDNDSTNNEKYGKLYNWYAVNDPRGLAPEGWHVPSFAECTILSVFLGGEKDFLGRQEAAATKLKSKLGWNKNETNESGFNASPAGLRSFEGSFAGLGSAALFWLSNRSDFFNGDSCAIAMGLSDVISFYLYFNEKLLRNNGLNVRCVKSYHDISLTSNIPKTKIGNQVWMTKNLDVDKFRNGDTIPQAKSKEEWAHANKEGKPAWCYFDNDSFHNEKYGKLYNWYAVNDPRGLAPEGWHIPICDEWNELADYLDIYLGVEEEASTSGAVIKKINTYTPKRAAEISTKTGFKTLLIGWRDDFGRFIATPSEGWWSSNKYDFNMLDRGYKDKYLYPFSTYKLGMTKCEYYPLQFRGGFPVRCVMDY